MGGVKWCEIRTKYGVSCFGAVESSSDLTCSRDFPQGEDRCTWSGIVQGVKTTFTGRPQIVASSSGSMR